MLFNKEDGLCYGCPIWYRFSKHWYKRRFSCPLLRLETKRSPFNTSEGIREVLQFHLGNLFHQLYPPFPSAHIIFHTQSFAKDIRFPMMRVALCLLFFFLFSQSHGAPTARRYRLKQKSRTTKHAPRNSRNAVRDFNPIPSPEIPFAPDPEIQIPEETPPPHIPFNLFNQTIQNVFYTESLEDKERLKCFSSHKFCSNICCYKQHENNPICRPEACWNGLTACFRREKMVQVSSKLIDYGLSSYEEVSASLYVKCYLGSSQFQFLCTRLQSRFYSMYSLMRRITNLRTGRMKVFHLRLFSVQYSIDLIGNAWNQSPCSRF